MKKDFARSYGGLETWHWWFRGRRRVLESILSHRLEGTAPKRILSIGCGPAGGLQWLTSYSNAGGQVVGLDIEPIHAASSENIQFVVGSIAAAPFANHSFDTVLALDVLEHLDDDILALSEASRLLKPGGLLVITVPALPSLWGGQDLISEHRRRYTKRSLRQLLESSGLSEYRITYFNTLLFPVTAAVRWSRRVRRKADQPRSDFDDNRPGPLNEILASVFSSERFLINRAPLPAGVSLLATCTTRN